MFDVPENYELDLKIVLHFAVFLSLIMRLRGAMRNRAADVWLF